MTVIVTNNLEPRYRGFLASCALEIAPGIYSAPRMSAAVRERVMETLSGWYEETRTGGLIMVWRETGLPGGQGVIGLGTPARVVVEIDGILLSKGPNPIIDSVATRNL